METIAKSIEQSSRGDKSCSTNFIDSGRTSGEAADPMQGFLATGTQERRQRSRRRQGRRFPIQQGEDTGASFLGGGTQPSEVTDALKATRQDVLEEAADKLLRRDAGRLPFSIVAVFVTEGDVLAIVGEDALRTSTVEQGLTPLAARAMR